MSIATVVTRGYGSFGTVNNLPPRGYLAAASTPATATTLTGRLIIVSADVDIIAPADADIIVSDDSIVYAKE